jgi:hypothetical protein
LKQSAASQDARYLDMLATMNGMGKKPIPDLQAGIVQHLPDVPFGYNNAHAQKIVETLQPPPVYQAPVTKVVETNAPPPSQTFVEPLPRSNDVVDGAGGGSGGDGSSVTAASPDGPTTVADLSPSTPSETPATLSPDETAATQETATPATQVATPTQPGFPGWDQVGNPAPNSNFNQNAPPSPPSNPLNEPDVSVAPTEVATTAPAPAPSINVDVNGNQVAAPAGLPSVNDPAGFAAAMAGIPGSGLLHSVNNSDMTNPDPSAFSVGMPSSVAVAVNQGNKGDSLNAIDVAPTTTVTVAPPDLNAPGFLAPGKSQQEAEQQNDDDTAAPSPGLLASVFDAITGNPVASNPGNSLAAMNAQNQAQSEQAAANVAAMNAPGFVANSLSTMNDVNTDLTNDVGNAMSSPATGFNVAGVPGNALAGPLGALLSTQNTDFDAPGFEQDASNNAAQTAISTALDNAATTAISNEADTSSPSAAPTGYSPGDMGFSGLDGGLGTGLAGAVAGPGFGGDQAASSGFGGTNAGGFASDVTGGFNADAASAAAAAAAASDTGGLGGLTGGFGGFGGISAGFGGVDADAGVGISADAGVGLGADASGDAGGDAGGDGGGGW